MGSSVICDDVAISGRISARGEVELNGEMQGDVQCGTFVLGEAGHIHGDIKADDVIIRGHVHGNVHGGRVTLHASAHVNGEIVYRSLAMEEGATFDGSTRRADRPAELPRAAE
jgi:cytoskeletal protein CcmA (bactofilin family)